MDLIRRIEIKLHHLESQVDRISEYIYKKYIKSILAVIYVNKQVSETD